MNNQLRNEIINEDEIETYWGNVYKITCAETDKIYIGSTTKPLNLRLTQHKRAYKQYLNGIGNNVTSFEIVKYASCKIELIERREFRARFDLFALERQHIEASQNVVNKVIPNRTKAEHYQDNKPTYMENHKRYYEDNKADIIERNKQYYQDNKQKITEYRKTPIECDVCRGCYIRSNKAAHFRTKKHLVALAKKDSDME